MNGQKRILELFVRLLNGEVLTKKELIEHYQKDGSTIQRDMMMIQEVLDDQQNDTLQFGQLDRKKKGAYSLPDFSSNTFFTDDEILAISKVLLESRAFSDPEMAHLITKFTKQVTDPKRLTSFIGNEVLYYQGVPEAELAMFERIHKICDAILHFELIEFEYTKLGVTKTFQRIPTAIFFSDLYFFMTSSSHQAEDASDFDKLNKFRINNMKNFRVISSKNKREYSKRFEAGVFHNQTANYSFLGQPINLVVDFYHDPAYIINRFPNSKIEKKNEDGSLRIAIVSNDGYGVKMWLLSQGDMVKVISPGHIIDYLVEKMTKTLSYYGDGTDKK